VKVPFAGKPGLEDTDILPLLTISDDGQWIAGGRVRFYVWKNDGTVVGDAGIEGGTKAPLNCLKFFGNSSQLAAGRKGLLRVYQLEPNISLTGAYPISVLSDNVNQANVIAAQIIAGKSYVVLATVAGLKDNSNKSGLALFELQGERNFDEIETFPSAQHATLTPTGQLSAVRLDPNAPVVTYDLKTAEIQQRKLVVPPREIAGKPTDARGIFSRVYVTPENELILNWATNNQQNTVSVTAEGELSKLSVLATPTVRSVGLVKDRAATFENGKVRFWNLDFEKSTVTAAGTMPENISLFELSPTGTTAFVVLADQQQMGLIDFETGKSSQPFDAELPARITAAGWSADGASLAFGFDDGSAGIWNENSFRPIEVDSAERPIEQIRFSADGRSLVIVQQANQANATADAGLAAFVFRKQSAVGDNEGANSAPNEQQRWISVRLSHADGDAIRSADISADGQRAVTGSQSGRVTIWNTASQAGSVKDSDSSERELLNLDRFDSEVRTVRFGEDESNVVAFETESSDHEGRVYPTIK
jgi:WD40 repeat protein